MGTATGLTAARMLAIEGEIVTTGVVDSSGDLILTRIDGTEINAGHVEGEKGDPGEDAEAVMTVDDTSTIDMSLTGSGTTADPWKIKGSVILPNVEKTTLRLYLYDSTTNGWIVKGADGVTYGPYQVGKNYIPVPGDAVWLAKDGSGSYIIAGANSDWKPLATSISAYNAINADNQWNYLEYCVRNGFVAIRGLLSFGATTTGQLIGTLPVGARPDTQMVIKINNSDVIRSLYIYTNGEVRANTVTTGGYYSLDGIIFPAAGRATWTYVGDAGSGLAFANSWTHYSSGTSPYGKVGFWRDEYDYIWTCGMAAGGTTAANVAIVNITNPDFLPWNGIPTPSASNTGEQHVGNVQADVIGCFNIIGGTTNAIRGGGGITPNTSWISFFGCHYLSSAAYLHTDWFEHPDERHFASGWSNYNIGYSTFAHRQRGDGMVTLKGLVKAGTLGQRLDWTLEPFRTEKSQLLATVANGAYARMDFIGKQNTTAVGGAGQMAPISGSNTWFSLDGMHWFP